MASELLKVALKPTCSNSEVKLIDGASWTYLYHFIHFNL